MKRFWHVLRILSVLSMVLLPLSNTAALAQGEDPPDLSSPSVVAEDPIVWGVATKPGDGSIAISWQSKEPQTGWVEYGASWNKMTGVAYDERGADRADTQHSVLIDSREAGSVIYYTIISGGQRFDNGGSAFKLAIGGEQFQVESLSESIDGVEAPDMQAESVDPAQPIGLTEIAVGETQFVVEWQTMESQTGWIEYGVSWDQMTNVAYDERGAEVADTRHRAVINSPESGAVIYYTIISGGQRFDNGGSAFKLAIGGEQFQVEAPPENINGVGAPDMQAEPIDPAQPIGLTEIADGESQFVVEWQTVEPQTGWIEYGASWDQMTSMAYDERGQDVVDTRHRTVIGGVESGQVYYYVVVSNGERFDNGGSPFKVIIDDGSRSDTSSRVSLENVQNEPLGWTQCQQAYEGIEFCTDANNQTYAAKIDLRNPNVSLRAVLANDNPSNPNANPTDSLTRKTAEAMAREWGAVLAINTDYFGENHHGVEGLFYRDGRMLDNVSANYRGPLRPESCDDDPGDPDARVCRSSLAISSTNYADIGFGDRPDFMYNVIAGGPIFMSSGQYTQPAVTTYYSSRDGRNRLRLGGESPFDRNYFSETTRWTVAGLNRDGHSLVLMSVGTNQSIDYVVQQLQSTQMGVDKALKLDGGGSTQMYYAGQTRVAGGRNVPSALLVFSRPITTDPDDNRTFTSGQTLNGTINPANDQDAYFFDASQGQRATIRMTRTSGDLDSYLYLYAPNDSLVDRDDDSGGNYNSLINQVSLPQNGRYRIVATSYNGGSTGAYSLRLDLASGGCSSDQYRAEYFNNRSLSGSPTFIRCEGWPINWDWGAGGPGNGVGNDNFSVRWTGRASINTGRYTFIARSDDGIKVWFDNNVIIDAWRDQGPTEYRATRDVSSGQHDIRVEYYENAGGAVAQFRWEQASASDPDDNRTLTSGQTLNGTINPANDQDTYFFDASQGQRATIRMTRTSGDLDSYLYLYAPNGSLVARDDDSGGNYNSLINQVSLPQNGRYRIVATSYNGGSTGAYSLRLDLASGGGGGPSGYTFCANENQRCSFSGTKDVAYGANGRFNYRYNISGGIDCNNNVFGDPISGVAKACYIKDSSGSGNIAANKSSWATSQESSSYPPRNGNDGNTGTRWSSQISSTLGWQWFKIDLGLAQTFDRFVVRWEWAYGARYWVAWCDANCTNNDNSNWHGFERRLSSRQDDTIDFGNETHRYIGVLMIDRAPTMRNYSFWEFEAYNRPNVSAEGEPGTSPELPTPMQLPEMETPPSQE